MITSTLQGEKHVAVRDAVTSMANGFEVEMLSMANGFEVEM